MENDLWSNYLKFEILFRNHGHRVLLAKAHRACYQHTGQKPASVMVWGCISAHDKVDLHICEGTIDAEQYITAIGTKPLISRMVTLQVF